VDDDEAVRDALSSLLRSAGYRCAAFESGETFLQSAAVRNADCTVLDVRMPGLSGLDVHVRMREMNCWVPVIFVTGHADESVRARAVREGAVAFLDKPFGDDVLLGAIQVALNSTPFERLLSVRWKIRGSRKEPERASVIAN
jgi:FixJ family two-component response regulator